MAFAASHTFTRDGHKPNVVFYKSCADAFKDMGKRNNIIVLGANAAVYSDKTVGGTKCPPLNSIMPVDIKPVHGGVIKELELCTGPTPKVANLGEMAGKQFRLGVPMDLAPFAVQVAKHNPQLGLTVVPYRGSGDLKPALLSGDVDFFLAGALMSEMKAKGANCVASSIRTPDKKLPFFGDLSADASSLPEFFTTTYLAADTANLDADVRATLAKVFSSPEWKEYITKYQYTDRSLSSTPEQFIETTKVIEKRYLLAK